MTGYARAQGSDERRRWVWEARSVNGRNLEIRCRVPPGFDRLENPARNAVGAHLKRGNVSLTLTVTSEQQGKPLRINRALLAELAVLVEEVRKGRKADSASAEEGYDALKKYTRDLTEALTATKATLAFDAVGGGPLVEELIAVAL